MSQYSDFLDDHNFGSSAIFKDLSIYLESFNINYLIDKIVEIQNRKVNKNQENLYRHKEATDDPNYDPNATITDKRGYDEKQFEEDRNKEIFEENEFEDSEQFYFKGTNIDSKRKEYADESNQNQYEDEKSIDYEYVFDELDNSKHNDDALKQNSDLSYENEFADENSNPILNPQPQYTNNYFSNFNNQNFSNQEKNDWDKIYNQMKEDNFEEANSKRADDPKPLLNAHDICISKYLNTDYTKLVNEWELETLNTSLEQVNYKKEQNTTNPLWKDFYEKLPKLNNTTDSNEYLPEIRAYFKEFIKILSNYLKTPMKKKELEDWLKTTVLNQITEASYEAEVKFPDNGLKLTKELEEAIDNTNDFKELPNVLIPLLCLYNELLNSKTNYFLVTETSFSSQTDKQGILRNLPFGLFWAIWDRSAINANSSQIEYRNIIEYYTNSLDDISNYSHPSIYPTQKDTNRIAHKLQLVTEERGEQLKLILFEAGMLGTVSKN